MLARELATGSVNARTLGSLFGALGSNITFLGIGAIVLAKGIYEVLQNAEKLQQEVDKIGAGFEQAKLQMQGMAEISINVRVACKVWAPL